MKIRLKFTKEGPVKFVGHLDTVRLFQRAIKVAKIPISYSQGYSPHSLVYFAMPLAVGVSSVGEYMDIITSIDIDPPIVQERLNSILVKGIRITGAFVVEQEKDSLMSLVQAADYKIYLPKSEFKDLSIAAFLEKTQQPTLMVEKKGKKGLKIVDIKPLILACAIQDRDEDFEVKLKVLAGSEQNLNPELFLKAIFEDLSPVRYVDITREEIYTYDGTGYKALGQYGR